MADEIIKEYNQSVLDGIKRMNGLGEEGITQMQNAMSVLVYRLSKILTNNTQPPSGKSVQQLLQEDMRTHPDIAALPQVQKALSFLCMGLELSASAIADRIRWGVLAPMDDTDDLYRQQHPSLRDVNKPYSTWGRPLPFRPLLCKLGGFALAFPVRQDAKRYDDIPGEDDPAQPPSDIKPKVRLDKQRTFATLLDAIDYMVGQWLSYLKSEVAYIGQTPAMASPGQRPARLGKCYWRKPKGSISPDVMIVRNRKNPPVPANVTHCLDMKFGNDDLGQQQQRNYLKTFPNRLYVLYFPSDCMTGEPGEKEGSESTAWAAALAALLLLLSRGRLRLPSGGGIPAPAF